MNTDIKLCKCGCGKQVKPNRIYVSGHNKSRLGSKMSERNKAKLLQSHLGKHLTEETKAKLSKRMKGEGGPFYGRHHTEEAKVKIGRFHLGKPLGEEQKSNISKALKGRKLELTIEQRKSRSLAHMGKHHTEETKTKLSQITKAQRIRTKGMPNSIDRTGSYPSEETRIKMGKAKKGHKFNLGKHHTEETKRKIGEAGLGRLATEETKIKIGKASKEHWGDPKYRASHSMIGENSPRWLGGISFEPYTKEFNRQLKNLIRMRDAYTCQLCGIPERETFKKLPIHHIDYNKSNSMPINLIVLCGSCNGKVNNNRSYWTGYFRDLLNKRQLNPKALVKKRKVTIPKAEVKQLESLDVICHIRKK